MLLISIYSKIISILTSFNIIRPISDLRSKYSEIENFVLSTNEPVFLTKNGYGSMVLLSLEQYSSMPILTPDQEKDLAKTIKCDDLEKVLLEMDKEIANKDTKFLTHEEVFTELRRKLNELL